MYLVIGVLPAKKRARRYGAPRQLLRKRDLLVSFEPGGSIRAKLSGASSRVPQMDSVFLPSGFHPWQNSSYKGDDVPVCFGTLALAEEMASFRPGLHQRELLDLHTLPDEVAGVHVEAI